jgi:DNA mismatch repair protein MutS2
MIVDLLSREPSLRVNEGGLRQALTFAFSAGGVQANFSRALSEASRLDSYWSPECFAEDLFLEQLLDRCLWRGRRPLRSSASLGVRAYVLGVLGKPPTGDDAQETLAFRQAISAELRDDAALLAKVNALVEAIEQLFELFEVGGVALRLDVTRRRLDILRAFKRVVDDARGFEGARSGLSRMAEWARLVSASPAYARVSMLVDHDEHLATVRVDLRLGKEGDIRELMLVEARENTGDPLHRPRWRRWLDRLLSRFGGYRIQRDEVYNRLIHDVFDEIGRDWVALFQLLGDLEFYRAGLSLLTQARAQGLEVCLPEFARAGAGEHGRALTAVFNPFLLLEDKPPKPCDLRLGRPDQIVIVTGPNSGGKTRLLQAVGISQVLGQAGLFVPAASARLPWANGLFASLTTSPDAEQREGRLGTELLRIKRLFEKLEVGALVIVDELCSGTNPSEAEELFRMVLALLSELSAESFISTHFLQFAAELERQPPTPSLAFLQAELDDKERPTYRFAPGVAPSALAEQTARRLGVTRDLLSELVDAARLRHERRQRS